jgi:hypothetical protein
MSRYRTQGTLAAGLALLITGCFTDPDLKTGLRPEGKPEVLATMSMSDSGEAPMFCKYLANGSRDDKAPGLVQGTMVCPDLKTAFTAAKYEPIVTLDVGLVAPASLRLVFDELLNGDAIETIENCDEQTGVCEGHIKTTLPVTVTCGTTALTYDGYYYPNGNKDSFPVGPSIVVTTDDFMPIGSSCTVVAKETVVKDKQGEAVAVGPDLNAFTFGVADLAVNETDPPDDAAAPAEVAPDGFIDFYMNAAIDDASISATDVVITTAAGAAVAGDVAVFGNIIEIVGAAPLVPGDYIAKIAPGASFDDVVGGSGTITDGSTVHFTVSP